MKKVLVILQEFNVGGILSSLSSLLDNIDSYSVHVDVFALYAVGESTNKLHNCNILEENIWLSSSIKHGSIIRKILVVFFRYLRKILGLLGIDIFPIYVRLADRSMHFSSYDAIISYSESLTEFVSYLPSANKIAWLHSVYSRFRKTLKYSNEKFLFDKYTHIVCVSNFAKQDFISLFPEYESKVHVIYNIIDYKSIKAKSMQLVDFETSMFTILSIGRLDPVKQYEYIPLIASEIKNITDIPFRWYILGKDCGSKQSIISNIFANNVEDIVFLLGEKQNPYPYLAKSNLFVHTSKSETYGLVIAEAISLGIPVVVNNFMGVEEVLDNEIDGLIIPIKKMSFAISEIMNGSKSFKHNVCLSSFKDKSMYSVNEFYKII